MAITQLPDPPLRSDPSTFADKGDAFMSALQTFVIEANALLAQCEANATTMLSMQEIRADIADTISTPPHFDADTSIATTAFVQRALGNHQGYGYITGNATLSAEYAGTVYEISAGSTVVTTLPSASGKAGLTFTIYNPTAYSQTVQSAGGVFFGMGYSSGSAVYLSPGTRMRFVSDGYNWKVSGSIRASSLEANGYSIREDGLIEQWCEGSGVTSEGLSTVTLPIAFPNVIFRVYVSTRIPAEGSNYNEVFQYYDAPTLGSVRVYRQNLDTASGTIYPTIFAIGK